MAAGRNDPVAQALFAVKVVDVLREVFVPEVAHGGEFKREVRVALKTGYVSRRR